MRHPDLFGQVYSLSPGLFDTKGLSSCQLFKSDAFINQYIKKTLELSAMSGKDALSSLKSYIAASFNAGDWDTPFIFAYGAAFSPDISKTIPCIDYPYSISDNTLVLDSVILKNYEDGYGGISDKINKYKENLLKLNSITIDFGTNDTYKWIPQGCKYFSDLLTSADINHNLVSFSGGHEDQVRKRIEGFMLPALSKNLVYDTTLTGLKLNKAEPTEFCLLQNYPNPFNPSTTISYQIPEDSFVSLKVYDLLGNEVSILKEGRICAGFYKTEFNANKYSSGFYICKLTAGKITRSIKLILLK
jgi:hypothetical protein